MAIDFPPNTAHPAAPAVGEKWPQPSVVGVPVYSWDGEKWTTIGGEIGSIGGADDLPLMDGVATPGVSTQWAREDHVHPTDTSLASINYVNTTVVNTVTRSDNILCPHERLVISRTDDTTVSVAADAVMLFDVAADELKRFGPLAKSPVITVSGINGLDSGIEAAGTWYNIWAIGKADGAVDTLLSLSETAPTMPAMYTFKGLIGAVRNDASSNFVSFFQRGNDVSSISLMPLNGGTQASYTAVSLSAVVPPNATIVDIIAAVYNVGVSTPSASVASDGSGTTPLYGSYLLGGQELNTQTVYGYAEVILTTPQQVKYYLFGIGAVDINVEGWTF